MMGHSGVIGAYAARADVVGVSVIRLVRLVQFRLAAFIGISIPPDASQLTIDMPLSYHPSLYRSRINYNSAVTQVLVVARLHRSICRRPAAQARSPRSTLSRRLPFPLRPIATRL